MRMPPLLADFIYNRVCELKCEKFLTRPIHFVGLLLLFFCEIDKCSHTVHLQKEKHQLSNGKLMLFITTFSFKFACSMPRAQRT